MVVVANRLPFDMEKLPDGSTKARQAPGGLVTALAPDPVPPAGRLDRLAGIAGRRPSSRPPPTG